MEEKSLKTCILIIGMHRSGTSATAGVLKALGVNFGNKLIAETDYNVKGCFEHRDIINNSQKILETLKSDGYNYTDLPPDWQNDPAIGRYKKDIERILKKEFSKRNLFAIKDPHLSLILPLVLDILKKLEVETKIIICNRNNLEIAKSLERRDGVDVNTALLLCQKYKKYIDLYSNSDGIQYLKIEFDDLLNDTKNAVDDLVKFVPKIPERYEGAKSEIDIFLSRELKHHNTESKQDRAEPLIKLSVIIPCFNDGKYLPEALLSLQQVKNVPLEIIIVDDGSSDKKTINYLNSLDKNIYKIIRQENKGPSSARNTGIEIARGKYILPLDADNKIMPELVYKALFILVNNPGADIIYSDKEFIGLSKGRINVPNFKAIEMISSNYIDTCAVFRKKVWEVVQGYDESILGLEDWDFWLSAYEKGFKFFHINEPLFFYRVKDSQESLILKCQRDDTYRNTKRHVQKKHLELIANTLDREKFELDGTRASLAEKSRLLNEITGSLSWKIVSKIQKGADAVFDRMPFLKKYRKKIIKKIRELFTPKLRDKGPDFIIIGASKCGTTSLFNYLVMHPQILSPTTKELHFFYAGEMGSKPLSWYKDQFPAIKDSFFSKFFHSKKITGEASPYYLFHPLVPERVHRYFPKVKLIALLRDPLDRAISHLHMCERNHCAGRAIDYEEAFAEDLRKTPEEEKKIIADPDYYSSFHRSRSFVTRGDYERQIARWKKYFREEQMLILKSEDLFSDPYAILNKVCNFLGIDKFPEDLKNDLVQHNKGAYKKISDAEKEGLKKYFYYLKK